MSSVNPCNCVICKQKASSVTFLVTCDLPVTPKVSAFAFNFAEVHLTISEYANIALAQQAALSGDSVAISENEVSQEAKHQPVSAPAHYTWLPGIECRDVSQHFNLNSGAAIEYIWRAGHKGDKKAHIQDLQKAIQKLEFEIERVKAFE